MTLSVYNEDFELIAQFDTYKEVSDYLGASIDCIQSYLSKSKKKIDKCIKNKNTNKFVYVRRDYFVEEE